MIPLNREAIEVLVSELKLKPTYHPTDGRVILNYDQIETPKLDPRARLCRGLTIDLNEQRIIARAFPRFFNLGEVPDEDAKFNWNYATCYEKIDGSLILLYAWQNGWHINTRGSFADARPGKSPHTWKELFYLSGIRPDNFCKLIKNVTYVFELGTPWTQVVKYHSQPVLYMLGAFDNDTGTEYDDEYIEWAASQLNVNVPFKGEIFNTEMIRAAANRVNEPTFEGFVIKDTHCRRLKVKNPAYVALHHLSHNGEGFRPRNLVPLLLAGEALELLTYFPDKISEIENARKRIAEAENQMMEIWHNAKDEIIQKDFALKIMGRTPLAGILFNARKQGRDPRQVFRESSDYVTKVLFDD